MQSEERKIPPANAGIVTVINSNVLLVMLFILCCIVHGDLFLTNKVALWVVIAMLSMGLLFSVFVLANMCKEELSGKIQVQPPVCYGTIPQQGECVIQLLRHKDDARKIAVAIVMKDFLTDLSLTWGEELLSPYIPTTMQVKEHPIESLALMFSSYQVWGNQDENAYYNFDLICSVLCN